MASTPAKGKTSSHKGSIQSQEELQVNPQDFTGREVNPHQMACEPTMGTHAIQGLEGRQEGLTRAAS